MLRASFTIAMLLTVAGCASSHPVQSAAPRVEAALASNTEPSARTIVPIRGAVAAEALAFDPHVPAPAFAIDLSRDVRQPQAILGYDEGVVEFFSIRTDDLQYGSLGLRAGGFGSGGYGSGSSDYFEREAISVKTGVRYH